MIVNSLRLFNNVNFFNIRPDFSLGRRFFEPGAKLSFHYLCLFEDLNISSWLEIHPKILLRSYFLYITNKIPPPESYENFMVLKRLNSHTKQI